VSRVEPTLDSCLAIGTGTVRKGIGTVHFLEGKERAVGKFAVMLALCLATATVANADIGKRNFGYTRFNHQSPASPASTPEIDPASALSGLTLLLGGLAVIRGRRKAP
jgi:hypothetical protein